MKRFFRTIPFLLLFALLAGPTPAAEDDVQTVAAAANFVASLDAGEVDKAWQEFSPVARIVKQAEQWQLLQRTLRATYGPVEKRTLRGVTRQSRYPMLADGRYAIVQFDTAFRDKRYAIETVVLMQTDDGRWLIHDYIIS